MDTKVKYCPICQSLKLSSGFCRNRECKLGTKLQITNRQVRKIDILCEMLVIDIPKEVAIYTKDKASRLINKMEKEVVNKQLFGGEE